jgi:hypothetical protein
VAHGASSQPGLTQPASAGSLARTLGFECKMSPAFSSFLQSLAAPGVGASSSFDIWREYVSRRLLEVMLDTSPHLTIPSRRKYIPPSTLRDYRSRMGVVHIPSSHLTRKAFHDLTGMDVCKYWYWRDMHRQEVMLLLDSFLSQAALAYDHPQHSGQVETWMSCHASRNEPQPHSLLRHLACQSELALAVW